MIIVNFCSFFEKQFLLVCFFRGLNELVFCLFEKVNPICSLLSYAFKMNKVFVFALVWIRKYWGLVYLNILFKVDIMIPE